MPIITRRAILSSAAAGAASAISTICPVAAFAEPAIRMAQTERRATTVDNPFIIASPVLGLANFLGSAGASLMQQDSKTLGDVFENKIRNADRSVPVCNVLFLYCALEPSGRLSGLSIPFRDVIKTAGAHIAVLAAETPPGLLRDPEFGKALSAKNDWPANIVITLSRNGDHFGRFFQQLFSQMRTGVSMPMAWVRLAPQGPVQSKDIPATIALMEAGHVAFGPGRS